MKKYLIILLALLAATTINAEPELVPVRPVPTTPPDGDDPRSPIVTPVFYLDGYTLTAADNTLGSTVELLDANMYAQTSLWLLPHKLFNSSPDA